MRIVIDGKPIPKKSTEFGNKRGWNTQKKFMDDIRMIIKTQYKGELLLGAVKIDVIYHMPIPKDTSKKKRPLLKWHIKRPDSDNMAKLIKDCMSGIVYKDDSQVADSRYRKIYDDNPRTEITIEELI